MDKAKKSRGGAPGGSREQEFYCSYTELWPVGRLVPNPRNPNTHPKKQLQLLAEIIKGHGWRAPITVSRRSGYIVRGHGRFAAALLIGCEQVPVDLQEYASEAEEYADMVADNQIAELSEIDQEELQGLIADLDAEGYNLGLLGFTDKNLQELLNAKAEISEDNFDVDAAAEAAAQNTITKRGDLWLLGNHRLLCGDSTDRDCVDRLMGGELADMVFTDPPYNVDYEGRTKKKLKIQNDKKSNDDFYSFLCAAFERMFEASKPGSAAYIWYADRESVNFRSAAIAAGWDLKQGLIWVKNVFVMGRQDYQWNHEPCLYAYKPGAAHRWYGGRKLSTTLRDNFPVQLTFAEDGNALLTFTFGLDNLVLKVPKFEVVDIDNASSCWHIARPAASRLHPTMKPIALVAKGILNNSKEGELVLDLFGGSGSTLVACEETGRRCCTMELDPVYCDVIVKRWEQLTGKKAVLKND